MAIGSLDVSNSNIFEQQLSNSRQSFFLERIYPGASKNLTPDDYREIFLILPYLLLEKADQPKYNTLIDVPKAMRRTYAWMSDKPDHQIAAEDKISRESVHGSRHRLEKWIGGVITFDEIQQARQAMKSGASEHED